MNEQGPKPTALRQNAHVYRKDIDGLRAIAVIAVVIFHAFPEWLPGGFIGVDIFFVISGFLISMIIFESLHRGTFKFRDFYSRRIRRIFPALIVVMLSCLAIGWVALLPSELAQLGKHVAAGAGFISNFVLWAEAGYFDGAAELKPLLHLWSLGIEEQFYLAFPVFIWFAHRRRWSLLLAISIAATLSLCLNLLVISRDPVATFYAPLTRMWELLCGSALAWAFLNQEVQPAGATLPRNTLSTVGHLLLALGILLTSKEGFPGFWAIVPVLGAVMVISAGPDAWLNRRLLSNRILVWVGLVSFPLYLWHWPLLSFARIIENGPIGYDMRVAAIVLAIGLAWATYKFVERPVRLGIDWAGLKTLALLLLMVVAGLAGLVTFSDGGFSQRINGSKKALNQIVSMPYPDVPYVQCEQMIDAPNSSLFDDCLLAGDEPPTLLFVGDSHTKQFRSTNWRAYGRSFLLISKSECLPFSNQQFMRQGSCQQAFDEVLRFIVTSPSYSSGCFAGGGRCSLSD